MPEDFFRPRVDPSRARTRDQEPWPDEERAPRPDTSGDPTPASENADDLLGPFDVIRRALDARRAAEREDPATVQSAAEHVAASPQPELRRQAPVQRTAPAATGTPTASTSVATVADASTTHTPIGSDKAGRRLAPNRRAAAGIVIIAAALVCGGLFAIADRGDSGHGTEPVSAAASVAASATPDAARAAAWVLGAIGPADVVACDVTVCAVLRARGFPASSMIAITARSNLSAVERAHVIVRTPLVRTEFGAALDTIVATEPLAAFGLGHDRVEVTAVAPHGAGSYSSALAADRADRRQAGAALLHNPMITEDSTARRLLADGLVDIRACALLAILAGGHTITLAGFTPPAPGAGPDLPATGMVIQSVDTLPAAGNSPAAIALLATVRAQQPPYAPMTIGDGRLAERTGLRIAFSQPGPLGLLGTTGP